jgi:hypothetical protein
MGCVNPGKFAVRNNWLNQFDVKTESLKSRANSISVSLGDFA